MGNPSPAAYEAAIGIVCYLYRTRELAITYEQPARLPPIEYQQGSPEIEASTVQEIDGLLTFTDASFARDQDLRSVNGFVTMYRNGAISWSSKGLKIICQSTTEAETAGASLAAKDLIYVRSLMNQIGIPPCGPTPLFMDSAGTYGYARHPSAKQRTKYFELWLTYIRHAHTNNAVSLHLVKSKTLCADSLTKALPRTELLQHRNFMMNIKN